MLNEGWKFCKIITENPEFYSYNLNILNLTYLNLNFVYNFKYSRIRSISSRLMLSTAYYDTISMALFTYVTN